jgi:hypothetical protein
MNPESPVAAISAVVAALDAMRIPWFLSGSLASSLHGVPRATNDADIVADLPLGSVPDLVHRLGDGYYADEAMIRSAFERRTACNVIWLQTMMKVDLSPPRFQFDRDAMERRQHARLEDGSGGGLDVQVASPEDTILSKLYWYTAGRSTSERQLRDVRGIVGVHGAALDRDYLERWAAVMGMADLLRQVLAGHTTGEPPPF